MHGNKGKVSVMKATRNLAEKNYFFGKLSCESLNDQMKIKALTTLMIIVAKINGYTKKRGHAHVSFQKVHGIK